MRKGGESRELSLLGRKQSREDVDAKREEDAMSLFKRNIGRRRHVGRRVAGVGVGVALMVLGLQAPAFAVAPTVASFTPTSGPDGLRGGRSPERTSIDFPTRDRDVDIRRRPQCPARRLRGPVGHRALGDGANARRREPPTRSVSRTVAGTANSTATSLSATGRRWLRADHHLVHADMWIGWDGSDDHRDEPPRSRTSPAVTWSSPAVPGACTGLRRTPFPMSTRPDVTHVCSCRRVQRTDRSG